VTSTMADRAKHLHPYTFKLLAIAGLCMLFSTSTHAFSTTNLQLLYGSQFNDNYYGNNTSNGNMTTLTLEHFSTWSHGDHYFFIDYLSGDFLDFAGSPSGSQSRVYYEWVPRLSLSALSEHNLSAGIVKDIFLAGQLNRDDEGFHAEMIGLGTDLSIPGFRLFSINAYLRKDNLNTQTWQSTTVWNIPLGEWLSFEGFIDLYGSDHNGIETHTQPQLLLNPARLMGHNFETLLIGIEWYYHHHRNLDSSVIQTMVKWIW